MSELDEIAKSIAEAEAAYALLVSTQDIPTQREAWNSFLVKWGISLNWITTLCKRQGIIPEESKYKKPASNPTLHFVWESWNAYHHAPDRVSAEALQLVPRPFTYQGEPFTFKGEPFTFSVAEEILVFRTIKQRNGELEPPEGAIVDVAKEALDFLHRSHAILTGTN